MSLFSFCFKCKEKTDSEDIEHVKTKNNRLRLISNCCICHTKKSTFAKPQRTGGDIVDIIGKTIGEVHFPGSNYLGPGTKFMERLNRKDQPVDRVDENAMHHDLAYHMHSDKKSRHVADRKLLQDNDAIENPTFKEKVKRVATKAVMKPKLFLGLGEMS
jgi:hypothetical protein